jgi:enediyne biosynthesis protein E5
VSHNRTLVPVPRQHSQAPLQPEPAPKKRPDLRLVALKRFALSITAFTVLGHTVLGFEQSPLTPVSTVLVGYALELVLEKLDARGTGRPPRYGHTWRAVALFLLPTHIAALAVSMLLYAGPTLWPYWLAVSIAVTSKYLVKIPIAGRWRHGFNPSNLGIVTVLIFFSWVGIAPPYHFTASVRQPWDWLTPLTILVAGTLLNAKLTGKGPLIGAWLAGGSARSSAIEVSTRSPSQPHRPGSCQ